MSTVDREVNIKKLSKRMLSFIREIELAALDINEYSVPLAKGQFPPSWAKMASKAFDDYSVELSRINSAFKEIFKEQIEALEEVVVPVKKTRKRK